VERTNSMILANATVDVIRPSSPVGLGTFRVEVWGKEPNDYVRVYEIQARNVDQAARMGIETFVDEIQRLVDGE
jgi:hypothetical protein